METISVVVPCYNEVEAIPLFYREICRISDLMPEYVFEYVFVNDGSKDATLSRIKEMAQTDSRVKYLSLSRNFGKEAAMYAGLRYASGDYVAIMDADLQDPPALLPEMMRGIRDEGYDCVATRRVTRKGEPAVRVLLRPFVLPAHPEIVQDRNHGRRPGLPASHTAICRFLAGTR